ncbi:hypothetical protein BGW39_002570, partial [Mortierella sp. 14UC]
SKLAILKHAPAVYRKRRPVDLRNRHGSLLGLSNDHSTTATATAAAAAGVPGVQHHNNHNNHHGPPPLLRRQSTAQRGLHKSFMEIDLPSIRALRREPSMMELDPPTTLFAPPPQPAHFLPGPWAFFQAAEAQRAQRQAQMEFLTKLQELRARDEQCFVNLMSGFARECPVQFGQLTGFMRRMENELAMAAAQEQQEENRNNPFGNANNLFQQHQQQQKQRRLSHGAGAGQDWWGRVQEHRESRGTKMGLMELAQLFGNQVQARSSHGEQFQREQQQRHLQQLRQQYGRSSSQSFDRRASHGALGTTAQGGNGAGGKGGRHGRGGRPGGINGNGQGRSASMPVLRRGKTFQQQQQAMQQLTAYQRQLYQHVQQTYQQQQQQQSGFQSMLGGGGGNGGVDGVGGGFVTSPISIPLTHELMEYAAMTAALSPTGPASPTSNSTVGLGQLQSQSYFFQAQQQQQFQQQQDPLELAAINMHMNMNSQGSSRRQRYKPTPVRTL